jgi:hypothetical protein
MKITLDYLVRHGKLERYQAPREPDLPYGANIYRLPDYSLWAVEHWPDETRITKLN